MKEKLTYEQLGVSASKEGVLRNVVRQLTPSWLPQAFVRVLRPIPEGPAYAVHLDTAGTKPLLTYLWWRQHPSAEPWYWIMEDALVMNLDDLLCTGFTGPFLAGVLINRNAHVIPDEILKYLTEGALQWMENLQKWGVAIEHAGGETADVGDIVSPVDVGAVMVSWSSHPEKELLAVQIQEGDVLLALMNEQPVAYDSRWNSGIGTNGLTLARYVLVHPDEFQGIPGAELAQKPQGRWRLRDTWHPDKHPVAEYLLTPARTYAPYLIRILRNPLIRQRIHGIIHCTGGGQQKVLRWLKNTSLRIVKRARPDIPEIFLRIREEGSLSWQEMFRVFNMGWRMELYVPNDRVLLDDLIQEARNLGIRAEVRGYVEHNPSGLPEVCVFHENQCVARYTYGSQDG